MSDVNEPRPPGNADEAGRHRVSPTPDTQTSDSQGSEDSDPQVVALQADIERTREQLASTVDQLQAKLDVKARASASARDVTDRARAQVLDDQGQPRPAALGVGGAVVAGLLAVVVVKLWQRRQRRRHPMKRRR